MLSALAAIDGVLPIVLKENSVCTAAPAAGSCCVRFSTCTEKLPCTSKMEASRFPAQVSIARLIFTEGELIIHRASDPTTIKADWARGADSRTTPCVTGHPLRVSDSSSGWAAVTPTEAGRTGELPFAPPHTDGHCVSRQPAPLRLPIGDIPRQTPPPVCDSGSFKPTSASPTFSRGCTGRSRPLGGASPLVVGKVNRNTLCPCRSAKKYKYCHGR